MDVIGIDVHGTGYSTQARCRNFNSGLFWGIDARKRTKKNIATILTAAKRQAQDCQHGGSLPPRYVNTDQTVRDLE